MLWDTGTWTPHEDDVDAAMKKGKLGFTLHGRRLQGNWALVRLRKRSPKDKDNWLLIKEHDEFERRTGRLATERETSSVKSGRSMDEIAADRKVWHSDSGKAANSAPKKSKAGSARRKIASAAKKRSAVQRKAKKPRGSRAS
jgi:bifunctional non-homologous end joining protein LigD